MASRFTTISSKRLRANSNLASVTRASFNMKSSVKILWGGCILLSAVVTFGARGAAVRPASLSEFANAPLYFEANAGPSASGEQFMARGAACGVLLSPAGAEIVIGQRPGKTATRTEAVTHTVRLQLLGANPAAKMSGLDQLAGKANYFIGNEPSRW